MLITSESVMFYSGIREDMTKLKTVLFKDTINGCSGGATCIKLGTFKLDGEDSFLVAAGKAMSPNTTQISEQNTNKQAFDGKHSWIFRCKFEPKVQSISYIK